MKKGQMFIVTMVFMTGLIFAVNQVLVQYSSVDMSTAMHKTDAFLIKSIKDTYGSAIQAHTDCQDAADALREVHGLIVSESLRDFVLDIRHNGKEEPNLLCGNWNSTRPVLVLDLHVVSTDTDTVASFNFTRAL